MTMRIQPLLLCPMCESFNAYGRSDRHRSIGSHGDLDELMAKLLGRSAS